MTRVVADISISLDGFVTGPDPGPTQGLGRGGDALHRWAVDAPSDLDAAILRDATERSGAVVMGRRLFDIVDGPDGWTDEMGYGAGRAAKPPFFVVTHQPPASVRLDLDFTFVSTIADAVAEARAAAGDRDVIVMGGGSVVEQVVVAGLADELRIHLAPIVLGRGTPLFSSGARVELVQRHVLSSPHATHLTYEVVPPTAD